jgi:hypothetical protein
MSQKFVELFPPILRGIRSEYGRLGHRQFLVGGSGQLPWIRDGQIGGGHSFRSRLVVPLGWRR